MLTTVTLGPKGPYMTIQGIVSKTIATVDTLKKKRGHSKTIQSDTLPGIRGIWGVRVW